MKTMQTASIEGNAGWSLGQAPRMTAPQALAFYVAVPTVVPVLLGWWHAPFAQGVSPAARLLVWVLALVPCWALCEAVSRLLAWWSNAGGPSLGQASIIAGGGLIGGLLAHLYSLLLIGLSSGTLPRGGTEFASLENMVTSGLSLATLWLIANYFFDRLLNVPRFRIAPAATTPSKSGGTLPVLAALGGLPARHLLSLEAQGHYVLAHTAAGTQLISYRFSDAVVEADALGFRVHRSHWVARHAIAAVNTESGGWTVVLTNGRNVPVSRTYRLKLIEATLMPPVEPAGK